MPHLHTLGIATLLTAVPAFAQLPPNKDAYSFPAGARVGTTVEVRLGGSDWTPDVRFICYHPRVGLTISNPPSEVLVPEPPYWFGIKSFNNDPRLPREVTARFQIPADLPPGPIRWGVANANGAWGGGLFVVGDGAEITEDERRTGPQDLPAIPITVNGRLRRIEEVDRYRFTATANGLVTADLKARRLGNEFNGVLEVFDGERRIAEAVDTEGVDLVLTFAVEKGKSYTVAVRDIEYRGYRNFTYRLALTPGPRVITAVPNGGQPGETRSIEFTGIGLATGQPRLEQVTREVTFPAGPTGTSFPYRLETPHGVAQVISLQRSATEERLEPVAPDPKLRRYTAPLAITGKIVHRGERDAYIVTGKKGDVWDVAVQARRIGSPIDATLTVLGPDGKEVTSNDDHAGHTDPRSVITLPADGDYQLIVRDVSGRVPDLASIYRLAVTKPRDRFALRTIAATSVPIGGKATLKVDVEREAGCKEAIKLQVAGLPPGVKATGDLTIPAGASTLAVPLECTKDAPASASLVQITGSATIQGKVVTQLAQVAYGDELVAGTLLATTLKPPFKVKSPDADNTRKVPRGSTHLADLIIERTDGFTGEIVFDMAGVQSRHRQGIRGPAIAVPAGQSRFLYPVTVPEWLETTRTSRIALVAMAKVKDPTGVTRYVMDAMDGQVTMSIEGALMKLSVAADEIEAAGGQAIDVPLKLARSAQLSGPVRVELIVPERLVGLVTAPPIDWPADRPTATLKLATKADPKLTGVWKFTARATAKRDGHPVVSEAEFEVEFSGRR